MAGFKNFHLVSRFNTPSLGVPEEAVIIGDDALSSRSNILKTFEKKNVRNFHPLFCVAIVLVIYNSKHMVLLTYFEKLHNIIQIHFIFEHYNTQKSLGPVKNAHRDKGSKLFALIQPPI